MAAQAGAGPYLAHVISGGAELRKDISPALAHAQNGWTQELWLKAPEPIEETQITAGAGDAAHPGARYFLLGKNRLGLWDGQRQVISVDVTVDWTHWHLLTATGDAKRGSLALDGHDVGQFEVQGDVNSSFLMLSPVSPPGLDATRFNGWIGGFSLYPFQFTAEQLAASFAQPPNFTAQLPEENAKPWPLQTRTQAGYLAPQPPELMPHGLIPASSPKAQPISDAAPLVQDGEDAWQIANRWSLLSNEDGQLKSSDGARISSPGFTTGQWLPATVPGTVLTTLIDRGIYPDPYYGLNNLAIPESLGHHDWWYRVEFKAPQGSAGKHYSLHFAGINYAAEVWLNGKRLGEVRGAFRRGDYDISSALHPEGLNALAVHILPPPHPGIPQEQSLLGGPGENGGAMVTDGPTFVATEGWDWIPAIRDRNIGIWQPVTLRREGAIALGDVKVITSLPLPRTDSADVEIHLPLHNTSPLALQSVITVAFEGVSFQVPVKAAPGDTEVVLTAREHPQLHLDHPRLWWPNGYGNPDLYHLAVTAKVGEIISDRRSLSFGVREVSYELSLFDHKGALRRVEAIPTNSLSTGTNPVDVRHEAMRQTNTGWASSMNPELEGTPALIPVSNEAGLTDLVIKVNGVRIAARGGNWGMDDARKRTDRARLEPYFRLHREANLNIIRNWVGQNTEETFYQLADEYGLMVWNDFWASTQNYNAEPGDPALFLDNARDVVRRFRNHPSIILWCGRNEGVPPPTVNEGLIRVIAEEDGTRFYSPSSNQVNLRDSGPYSWQEPSLYFTKLNRGFSVELGISSFPTDEAFAAMMPAGERWPISDTWAYHDWHQKAGGDTHELMKQMVERYGEPKSLDDFEKRIQLFNYVDHRAIFEGFYQHLWAPNSGRMLWMTQPAWPSTNWQIYSSDYDTQASYYGVKKANEPLHVQMDPSDGTVAVVNSTLLRYSGLTVVVKTYSAKGDLLLSEQRDNVVAATNQVSLLFQLPLTSLLQKNNLVFLRLELRDGDRVVSDNFYWLGKDASSYKDMNQLPQVVLHPAAKASRTETEDIVEVLLANTGANAAIEIKLTLLDENGQRILPAYYSDNYISLLPGERRSVSVRVPKKLLSDHYKISVRGWNVAQTLITGQ